MPASPSTPPAERAERPTSIPVQDGYGKPTIAWQVKNISTSGTLAKVAVKGITCASCRAAVAYRYTVRMLHSEPLTSRTVTVAMIGMDTST